MLAVEVASPAQQRQRLLLQEWVASRSTSPDPHKHTHCSSVTHDRHMPPFLPLHVLRKFCSPSDFRGQLQMCISGAALAAPPSSQLPVSLPCQAENKMKTSTASLPLLPPTLSQPPILCARSKWSAHGTHTLEKVHMRWGARRRGPSHRCRLTSTRRVDLRW